LLLLLALHRHHLVDIIELATQYGWSYDGQLAGHLIGHFPHERLEPTNYDLYVHPENPNDMFLPDANGNKWRWILEIHFNSLALN